jgi:uncharacterized protein
MKYLVLLILLVVVFYKLTGRRNARPGAAPPPAPRAPQDMIACAECGVHLPLDEALPGRGGSFCSAAHRAAFEARRGGGA